MEFVIGAKSVISGFDKAVKGLKIGETRKQDILPQDGYGNLLCKARQSLLNFAVYLNHMRDHLLGTLQDFMRLKGVA